MNKQDKTMTNGKGLVLLVAVLALAILSISSASAFASIEADKVSINGVEVESIDADRFAAFAGETVTVTVPFVATENAEDVRVKAWISGDSDLAVSTGRFDVIEGNLYTRTLSVKMPTNIDPSENVTLYITVENKEKTADGIQVALTAQRENYVIGLLDVAMASKVNAGDNLAVDIVLKNKGRHLAEDTFVTVSIPALGIEQRAYFGDLSSVDQTELDNGKEDAAERRMSLAIPADAAPGVYEVEVEAFNSEADSTVTRKVAVVGGARESTISVSAVREKSFAVGEEGVYSLTLVNSGNKIRVYELVAEAADKELKVDAEESLVVVPAGSSKTVKVRATATEAGKYDFAVKVFSGSELANKVSFTADVRGNGKSIVSGNDAAVLITVVLAIIFVVLLVVLIVLLTRKPQKAEEFGESYY